MPDTAVEMQDMLIPNLFISKAYTFSSILHPTVPSIRCDMLTHSPEAQQSLPTFPSTLDINLNFGNDWQYASGSLLE